MPSDLARLAWRRLLTDLDHRTFYRHPYADQFLSAGDLDSWLEERESALTDTFVPGPAPPIEYAKADFHVRPGLRASLADQFAYHLIALRSSEIIGPLIDWSSTSVRFSHRLTPEGSPHWFRSSFVGWRNFCDTSIGLLNEYPFVLVADVSGFYENIDVGRLVQGLRAQGVEHSISTALSNLLNKWAGPRRRGIPQGMSPSDLFAEFFMNELDSILVAKKVRHIRFSDDMRIFANSEREARLAMHVLERVLRSHGLNPQTAKTVIHPRDEAHALWDAVPSSLRLMSKTMAADLQLAHDAGAYINPSEISKYLDMDANEPLPEVVEGVWEAFQEGKFGAFQKTLFNFLLARLGKQGSLIAVEVAIANLEERPHLTDNVLKYLAQVQAGLTDKTLEHLAMLATPKSPLLFEHQRYQLLSWFVETGQSSEILLEASREGHRSDNPLLRPHWVAYLGTHAAGAGDFDILRESLDNETEEVARATLLFALRNSPQADRDLLYARCQQEGPAVKGAVKLARTA